MASTLLKYHLKRWIWPLLGSCIFFGGLLTANDLVQVSKDLFSQGAPLKWLVPLMATTLPQTFALVLPMASILGGLMGTQQLSESSEMVASQGLGVGLRSILKAWAILAAALVVLASANAHILVPKVSGSVDHLQEAMTEDTRTRFLKPGGLPFFPPQEPRTGVWVSPQGEMHMFQITDTDVQHMVAKDFTWQRANVEGGKTAVVLKLFHMQGCYYQKKDGNVGLLDQQTQTIRMDVPPRQQLLAPTPVENLDTPALFRNPTRECWIEISRRVTLPLSTMAFLLLGIALGMGHPRFRKGGALVRSLGVIIAYYLVLKFVENRYLAGRGPASYLFLPPFLFLAAGFLVLWWKMRLHRAGWNLLGPLRGRPMKALHQLQGRMSGA
ncbi:MAG TPA: LptF/LptG family permease, partial [Holophaga sp.]|nr:LptF/LptG family permease [Holophaga sp.]